MWDVFVALQNSDIKNSTWFKKKVRSLFSMKNYDFLELYLDVVNGDKLKMWYFWRAERRLP